MTESRSPSDRKRAARIARAIEGWFAKNQRPLPWRAQYQPYHVWVSEVMAQQTRMEVVVDYFPRFIARFPTIASLAGASESDVVALWSGLGYYRRARMLHRGAREVVNRFGGELPESVEELKTIPGLGRYTAGSIASIAFGRRAAIVDGNVARVVSRINAVDAPWRGADLERAAWEMSAQLVAVAGSPRDFNQGLMELGASVCRPRSPRCEECPIRKDCQAFASGTPSEYPRRAAARKTVDLVVPLWVFEDRRGRVLFHEAAGRVMAGMLHLPHGNDLVLGASMRVGRPGQMIGSFRHSVTHRRITFEVYTPQWTESVADAAGDARWVHPDELAALPHPSYVRKALEVWKAGVGAEGSAAPRRRGRRA